MSATCPLSPACGAVASARSRQAGGPAAAAQRVGRTGQPRWRSRAGRRSSRAKPDQSAVSAGERRPSGARGVPPGSRRAARAAGRRGGQGMRAHRLRPLHGQQRPGGVGVAQVQVRAAQAAGDARDDERPDARHGRRARRRAGGAGPAGRGRSGRARPGCGASARTVRLASRGVRRGRGPARRERARSRRRGERRRRRRRRRASVACVDGRRRRRRGRGRLRRAAPNRRRRRVALAPALPSAGWRGCARRRRSPPAASSARSEAARLVHGDA